MRAVFDEVVGPDVVRPLGPQRTQEPSFSQSRPRLGCLGGHLQTFATPDALDPLIVHTPNQHPAAGPRSCDTVATVLTGQLDEVGRELLFVISAPLVPGAVSNGAARGRGIPAARTASSPS